VASLTQEHLALLTRHRLGVGRLIARSRVEPQRLLVIIAHVESAVGQGFIEAGLFPATGRTSIVVPTGFEAARTFVPALLDPEVIERAARHGATAVVIFGREGPPGITFERFQRKPAFSGGVA